MNVLSAASQKQVEEALITDGFLTQEVISQLKLKAEKESKPFFATLVDEGKVSNEILTKEMAKVNHVPYVNLLDARIERDVLRLLSKDIAERYMAVPLGQIQQRLVVAMLDADNVQAVDFLANRIGRQLKVYTASEEGIRRILKQYDEDVEADVAKRSAAR